MQKLANGCMGLNCSCLLKGGDGQMHPVSSLHLQMLQKFSTVANTLQSLFPVIVNSHTFVTVGCDQHMMQ